MSSDVLILIPTYNERDNVGPIASAALGIMPEAEVLFIDDNSPDGTGHLLDQLCAADARIRVLHRPGKQGLGKAYLEGFRLGLASGHRYFIEMDADFSHDPRYLPDMVRMARAGADVVIGSRYVAGGGTENWGLLRQVISRGGGLYARTVLGVGLRDLTSGFVCYRREVLENLDLAAVQAEGYGFQIEMKYRALRGGFAVEEMPIVFVDRRVGQSKMSRRIFMEALGIVFRLRFAAISPSASGRASPR
jgi:dolichol-phosphate mannosyltransferase